MPEITLEKTHALLEKLAEYVMNEVTRKSEVPTRQEMDAGFAKVDERFAKVDERFAKVDECFAKVDTRFAKVDTRLAQLEYRLEKIELEKADKKDIQTILSGLDKQAKQLDIIRTEQVAFNHAFRRLEKRVETVERS